MGAGLILSPCAWAVPANHDNRSDPYGGLWQRSYQPVAREFGMWIAGCSNVGLITAGPWQGRQCIGASLVVNAAGHIARQGPYGVDAETLLEVDIPLSPTRSPSPIRGCEP
jgi:predicted amidohydrolase